MTRRWARAFSVLNLFLNLFKESCETAEEDDDDLSVSEELDDDLLVSDELDSDSPGWLVVYMLHAVSVEYQNQNCFYFLVIIHFHCHMPFAK